MVHIDPTIHVGDIFTAIVGALITAIGYGVRKCYYLIINFIDRVEHYGVHIERAAKVVDGHSSFLVSMGSRMWPRLSQKRRSSDLVDEVEPLADAEFFT